MTPADLGLAVVVVNYRSGPLVRNCLDSLRDELVQFRHARVVVVDNDSKDGSADVVEEHIRQRGYGGWAECVRAPRNGGFSAGNNLALRPLLDDERFGAFLLLNPDTTVRPGALAAMVRTLGAEPRVGIVGSRLEDENGGLQRSAFRFPSPMSEFEWAISSGPVTRALQRWTVSELPKDHAHRCSWVSGASMLIVRGVFESIGLFDSGYFLYFEEVDFCLRAARAGWKCWHQPESRIVHLMGQSTGITNGKWSQREFPACWFDSRRRFFLKNYGWLGTAAADASQMVGGVLGLGLKKLQGRDAEAAGRFLRSLARNTVYARGFQLQGTELDAGTLPDGGPRRGRRAG